MPILLQKQRRSPGFNGSQVGSQTSKQAIWTQAHECARTYLQSQQRGGRFRRVSRRKSVLSRAELQKHQQNCPQTAAEHPFNALRREITCKRCSIGSAPPWPPQHPQLLSSEGVFISHPRVPGAANPRFKLNLCPPLHQHRCAVRI